MTDCELETVSNYYTKAKETFIDKLEKKGRGKFEHKDLKTHEEHSNDSLKFFFMLDRKWSLIESKGWNVNPCWYNVVGNDKKKVKIRKHDSHHKLPVSRCHELHSVVKKIISYEGKPVIQITSHIRFYSKLKLMLSQEIEFVNKKGALWNTNNEE